MAKKKKSQQNGQQNDTNHNAGTPTPQSPATAPAPKPSPSPTTTSTASKPKPTDSTSALIICRNKHWRYISSFHGPWLQLPPEVLESLAHSNYLSPRPHPIDPAVFYDLVKIRKAVDEATNLAVRAASGLTSNALSNSLHAGNGILGGAAALGLGYGGGGNGKMSRERKHRMRELATQKLSHAYHLDEIAASVATMQSTSTLEDVAQFVLQRNENDIDGKYVHFFHEKIPSRMMAECTPLDALNDIIAERPTDGSPMRTRALTQIFKEDYLGAARDLSEALAVARYWQDQHRVGKDQLVLSSKFKEQYGRDWRQEARVEEEDQPNSLEAQCLFHRAGVYFTIACGQVHPALDGLQEYQEMKKKISEVAEGEEVPAISAVDKEGQRRRLEARKNVKTYAKRALRDYTAFLSNFEYTPGLPLELAEDFFRKVNALGIDTNGTSKPDNSASSTRNSLLNGSTNDNSPEETSSALIRRQKQSPSPSGKSSWPRLPPPEILQISALFNPNPPPCLPPYPPSSLCSNANSNNSHLTNNSHAASLFADSHEAITYHPLLTDALHSLLLSHALIQTPPTELKRHAHNAARLARVCDGYPIFLAARSPARADWIEVLRRTGNWINLSQSWETLCRPAPLPGHGGEGAGGTGGGGGGGGDAKAGRKESEEQRRERMKHEAILEALADERVVDEDSFQRAVRARERRAREDEESEWKFKRDAENGNGGSSTTGGGPGRNGNGNGNGNGGSSPAPQPKRWAQEDGKEYPISTERAEAISRWVREAPLVMEGVKTRKKKTTTGKTRAKGKKKDVPDEVEEPVEEEEVD